MNDGNNQDYNVSGGIGLISAKLNVEGPIQKDKSSFLVSGRRTYADVFLKLSKNEEAQRRLFCAGKDFPNESRIISTNSSVSIFV